MGQNRSININDLVFDNNSVKVDTISAEFYIRLHITLPSFLCYGRVWTGA